MGDKDDDKEKSSGCRTCAKIIIIIANIIFFLVGAGIMTIGILLLTNTNIWGDSVSAGGTIDFIPKLSTLSNLETTNNATSSLNLDLSLITNDLGIALTVIGGVVLLMGIFGLSILCCDDIISTVLYIIIFSVLIIAQIAILIVFTTGLLNNNIKDRLKSNAEKEFAGADNYESASVAWNFMMIQFKCCGVDSYADFSNATLWNKTRSFTINSTSTEVTLTTPLACCKFNGTLPSSADYIYNSAPTCAQTPLNQTISNYDQGCWGAVGNSISSYRTIIIAVTSVVIVLQIALLVITLVLFCCKKRKTDDDEEEAMKPPQGKPQPRQTRFNQVGQPAGGKNIVSHK